MIPKQVKGVTKYHGSCMFLLGGNHDFCWLKKAYTSKHNTPNIKKETFARKYVLEVCTDEANKQGQGR